MTGHCSKNPKGGDHCPHPRQGMWGRDMAERCCWCGESDAQHGPYRDGGGLDDFRRTLQDVQRCKCGAPAGALHGCIQTSGHPFLSGFTITERRKSRTNAIAGESKGRGLA